MATWTIRRRIIASFGVVLALIVAVESVSLLELGKIGVATDSLQSDSLPSFTITGEMDALWAADHSLTQQYAAAPDSSATGSLPADIQTSRARLEDAAVRYEKTIFRADDREAFEKVQGSGIGLSGFTTANPRQCHAAGRSTRWSIRNSPRSTGSCPQPCVKSTLRTCAVRMNRRTG